MTSSLVGMAEESVEQCTLSVCADDGRAPPLVSGCRNTCDVDSHDSVRMAQSSNDHSMLIVDNGARVHTDSPGDTTQDASCDTPELKNFTCQESNHDLDCSNSICSSVVSASQKADVASSDQLQGDSQQSSVERLRKQMEILSHDEDIAVHCDISDDDHGSQCSVNESESEGNLIKSTRHSSNSDTVLLSRDVVDDGDGVIISNVHEVAMPSSQQQVDASPSDVPCEQIIIGHSYNSASNSARGQCFFTRLPVCVRGMSLVYDVFCICHHCAVNH